MLEGIVANLLNRFLGMYVQNFDPKQLNVGIWSGDVKLRNLELRREALDQLHLPINVVQGHLGLLTLTIPWSNLRGKPVHVNIEDVYLLAAPREDQDVDPEDDERRAHAVKMEKLDSAELLKERNTEGMSQEEQKKNQSFTASLTTAIVDNLQISVKNVHIRYEDSISDPGHPFAAGLTLHELSAVSTDENWKPTFIQGSSTSSHKLATLGALAIYWDTDTKLLGTGRGDDSAKEQGLSHDDVLSKLKDMIPAKDTQADSHNHQYILKPVTGRAGLEMDKTGKTDRPKTKARLLFNQLGFVVDDDQYRDVLMLVDLFHYFVRHQEYRKMQPKASPKEDPRAWLTFAGKAVLDKIHDRNKQWSWAYLKERRDDRLRYIELFKKKKKDEKLTNDDTTGLDALERKASYEDLRFWRSLARNQLRKENVGVKKAPQKQTWSQWMWGSGTHEDHADDSQMSEEQRKELYSAIDFDEKKMLAESVDAPREAVKLQVDMGLREGSFTLKRDPHGANTDILHLAFQGFDTRFLQRTDSMLLDLSLDAMNLIDGTTPGNKFKQALRVKDAKPLSGLTSDSEVPGGQEDAAHALKDKEAQADRSTDDDQEDPFFALTFEKNPLRGSADSALSVKLKAIEYVYNPNFAVQIVKFFKPPERQMESIGALMETAGATVEGLRQQTRAGLEFALQEHKTIDAQLDLQAPLIIVPDTVTGDSNICMILDAGHIAVRSDLIDKDTMDRIQSKQKQKYTDEDFELLSELMYDKFDVRLDSMQLLLGSSIDETRKQLADDTPSKTYHIVERINMDFKVEICIVPKVAHLTKFRINGHLPVLHASVSDAKYKALMKLLDVAIPKFHEDELQTPRPGPRPSKSRSKSFMDSEADRKEKAKKLSSKSHSELVIEDDASDDARDVKRKPSEIDNQSLSSEDNADQRNFEFKFTVDKLQGSLFRADPEGRKADQLLVDLVAQGFYLEFYQRPFDMVAEVKLHKLAVEDHIEESASPEFQYLVSSDDTSVDASDELFQLKFVKVNKDAPKLHSEHDGVAMQLDVSVSTINLMVTRKTLLTLLDFVLATFTTPQANDTTAIGDGSDSDEQSVSKVDASTTSEPDKIRIKAQLKRIAVILNDDGIRLATLSLSSAEVALLLAGKAMDIRAKLGNLSLIDDVNQGASSDSSIRQLIDIQGDELADFRYETFDPDSPQYPGHDSMIFLRAGSVKVNFITEPFRKIMEFGVKFGKMQAIFNAAREAAANQATNISQRASKMRFHVLVKTPIVAFPRIIITDSAERDTMTAHLGEVYAHNEFLTLDESTKETANELSAGLRNIKLVSRFNYLDDEHEELELLDKLDLNFKITSMTHRVSSKAPDTVIESTMSDLKLKITEAQMKFMLELSRSIPEAFAMQPDDQIQDDVVQELPDATTDGAKALLQDAPSDEKIEQNSDLPTHQGPELGNASSTNTKLDLAFKVGTVGLELISGKLDQPIGDTAAASLSTFALNEASVKLRMVTDGSIESELLVQSFSISDTRTHEKNKFRKIMTLISTLR